jgi:ABC-type multidrug transport system ATPase subunit
MMDDPLSALDMHVADLIMSQGICGYLKDKTRIIVTNAIQHLKYADLIYVVDNGKIEEFEGLEKLQSNAVYQELKKTTEVNFFIEEICFLMKKSTIIEEQAEKAKKKKMSLTLEDDEISYRNKSLVKTETPLRQQDEPKTTPKLA